MLYSSANKTAQRRPYPQTGEPTMSKANDAKRDTKKAPQKTPAEKKLAKREKKNKRPL
jgi:hypothetical protein